MTSSAPRFSSFPKNASPIAEVSSSEHPSLLSAADGNEHKISNWDSVSRPDLVRAKVQAAVCKENQNYLGPADLCMFKFTDNTEESSWWNRQTEPSPLRFHWVLGLNCSNALALGLYTEQANEYYASTQASWFFSNKSTLAISNASLFIWNPLRLMDLRVDVRLPGSMQVEWLRYSKGTDKGAPPTISSHSFSSVLQEDSSQDENLLWKELYCCSVLRYCAYLRKLPITSSSTRVLDIRSHLNKQGEAMILQCIMQNLDKLHRSGTARIYESEPPNAYNNQMMHALLQYFDLFSRHSTGIKFFTELAQMQDEPAFLILVAELHLCVDELQKANKLICEALDELPDNSEETKLTRVYLSLELCRIYTHKLEHAGELPPDDVQHAMDLLKWILSENPHMTHARLLYAQILGASNLTEALLQLNQIPFSPEHIPHTTRLSPISSAGSMIDLPKWLRLLKQYYSFPVREGTVIQTAGLYCKVLPGLFLTKSEKEIYTVMVTLLNQHGWKKLLEARSSAFLMQSDIDKLKKEKQEKEEENATPQSLSPALTVYISGIDTEESRRKLEESIEALDIVSAVTVDPSTNAALIALNENRNEQIVKSITDLISGMGFEASLEKMENDVPLVVSSEGEKNEESTAHTKSEEEKDSSLEDVHLESEQKSKAKIFSQKYFDNLFTVLYKDLCALSKFKKESTEQLDSYTSLDYAFVGRLFERLRHMEGAVKAWEKSREISGNNNVKALQKLLRYELHTAERSRKQYARLITLLDQLIAAHGSKAHSSKDEIQIVNQPPLVLHSIRRIANELGISNTRDLVKEVGLRSSISEFVFDEMLFDLVRMMVE